MDSMHGFLFNYSVEVFIKLIMCHQDSADSSQSHKFSPIIIVHLLLFGQSKNKVTCTAINTINIFIHQLNQSAKLWFTEQTTGFIYYMM